MKKNAINWFEIYVNDFDAAKAFYDSILGTTLEIVESNGCKMGMFPCEMGDPTAVGGCITSMEHMKPGPGGSLVYLNVEGEIDAVVARVADAGGKVVREKFAIPPHGFIAIIEDSEGNVVGLHSMS